MLRIPLKIKENCPYFEIFLASVRAFRCTISRDERMPVCAVSPRGKQVSPPLKHLRQDRQLDYSIQRKFSRYFAWFLLYLTYDGLPGTERYTYFPLTLWQVILIAVR